MNKNQRKAARVTKVKSMRHVLRRHGARLMAGMVQEIGATLSVAQVASRLGIAHWEVNDAKKHGELLAFSFPEGSGERYPAWQFSGKTVRLWIPKVIEMLGNGFGALSFLLTHRISLGGHRYLDRALSGNQEVIDEMLARAARLNDSITSGAE